MPQWTVPSHSPWAFPDSLYSQHVCCSNCLFLPHRSRNFVYKHQVLLCPCHHCCVTNNSKRGGLNPLPLMVVRDSVGQRAQLGGLSLLLVWGLSGGGGGLRGWGALACLEALSLTYLCWGSKTHTRPSVPTMWPSVWLGFLKACGLRGSPAHAGTRDSKLRSPSTQLRLTVPWWPCPESHTAPPPLSTAGRGCHQPAQISRLEMPTLPLGWRRFWDCVLNCHILIYRSIATCFVGHAKFLNTNKYHPPPDLWRHNSGASALCQPYMKNLLCNTST